MIPHSHHRGSTFHHHSRLEAATNEQKIVSEELGQRQDAITNFEPSLVVVIGLLAVMFLLTILLLLYFKSCHRNTATSAITSGDQQDENSRPSVFVSPAANANTLSGLDKKAIQSLPFFRFGVLRGSKEGLECAVCLSKYEEAEILRLLPKCRHAFHVDCVDRWLSHHSTCPLCRSDVVANDSSLLARSNTNQEVAEESISNGDNSSSASIANDVVELFVEREDEETQDQDRVIRRSSSKFSIGSSFGRLYGGEGPMPMAVCGAGARDGGLHKHNHKIVFSDVVFKNRWSNVSSSDLIFLRSEMILSSDRFSRADSNRDQSAARASIGAEAENKKRISIELAKRNSNASSSSPTRALLNSGGGGCGGDSSVVEGRRSVSEITLYSRCKEVGGGDRAEEGERKRKIWFPIARKTVEWFANSRREQTDATINHQPALNAV